MPRSQKRDRKVLVAPLLATMRSCQVSLISNAGRNLDSIGKVTGTAVFPLHHSATIVAMMLDEAEDAA